MIQETIKKLNSELPATVKLVAVSKFHPLESIIDAYQAGQRIFAESRPQEFLAKISQIADINEGREEVEYGDIQWHFIGHLQTNKLKMVLPYVSLVESVDSLRLLQAINKWGTDHNKVINILLECHISGDATKQGFTKEEVEEVVTNCREYPFVRICGVMGMASLTDDENLIRSDFARLVEIHKWVESQVPDAVEISMGMSDDYKIAVEMGSTMVRIGSMIFGPRQY